MVHLFQSTRRRCCRRYQSHGFLEFWTLLLYYSFGGYRMVSVLYSGTEGPWFKPQSRRCRVTVLGKLFTPIVPLFTKQQNW